MQTTQHIQVNDISISYSDTGTDFIPLIFIHGFPFNQSSWAPQAQGLSNKARVITYDLRGFGGTTAGLAAPGMDVFADDLIRLMDKLNIAQAVVCGLSMGGYILLNALLRYPQRFKAAILSDTQCLADSKENKEKRYATIAEIEKNGLEAFAGDFVKKVFTGATLKNNPELVAETKRMITGNAPAGVTAALKALAEREETCSSLKDIALPTLVLCGKEDTLTPPSLSEYLFNAIQGARLQEIGQAAHLANLEQPEEFNRHIREFLSIVSW